MVRGAAGVLQPAVAEGELARLACTAHTSSPCPCTSLVTTSPASVVQLTQATEAVVVLGAAVVAVVGAAEGAAVWLELPGVYFKTKVKCK